MNPRGWCARVRGERCQEPRPSLFADADEEQVKEAVISPPQRRVRNIASAVLSELRDPASRRQNAEGTSEPQPFRFREATGGERLETELDAVEHRSRQPCPGPAGPPTRKAAQPPVLVPEVYPNSRRPFPITPTCPADPGYTSSSTTPGREWRRQRRQRRHPGLDPAAARPGRPGPAFPAGQGSPRVGTGTFRRMQPVPELWAVGGHRSTAHAGGQRHFLGLQRVPVFDGSPVTSTYASCGTGKARPTSTP